jgi:hypothetical protein
MEAFFVVVMAALVLTVGVWALTAMRRLFVLTDRRPGDN